MTIKDSYQTYQNVDCPLCSGDKIRRLYQKQLKDASLPQTMDITVQQCDNCGFVFNSPRATTEFLKDYYANSPMASGQIYRNTSQAGYYPQLNHDRAVYFSKFLNSQRNGKFLDIGCGQGGFIEAMEGLLNKGWTCFGLEPSHEAVRIATEKGHSVTCGLLGDDLFDAHSFDAISLVSVLEHLPNPKEAIEAIRHLLKPDGIVFVEVPNTLHPEFSLTGHFSLEHICHFSPFVLYRLFVDQGWRDAINDPRISDHGLRLVGSKSLKKWGLAEPDIIENDLKELQSAIELYAQKETQLTEMLSRRVEKAVQGWRAQNTPFAIYGAGAHTIQLMSYVNLMQGCSAIIDSDPRKQGTTFLDCPVIAPDELIEQGIKAVLISSQRFQNEIEKNLTDLYGIQLEIATCYDDPENLFIA